MARSQEQILTDMTKRISLPKTDFKRMLLNHVLRNSYTPLRFRYVASKKRNMLCQAFSIVEHRNKCRFSGRTHYVITKTGMARMVLKDIAGFGWLCGLGRYGI